MLATLATLALPGRAWAIRPFVTDDARVVGNRAGQLESWVLVDPLELEHNILLAVGPTRWLELTMGMIHGGVFSGAARGYSVTGPLLQTKALLLPARNNRWPGVSISLGAFPPVGYGDFTPPGWQGFAFLALTESLNHEAVLIHANVGVVVGDRGPEGARELPAGAHLLSQLDRRTGVLATGGVGTQVQIYGGFHGVAEVYYGDPFDLQSGFPATQVGFRHIFTEEIQIDGTFGTTLTPVSSHGGTQRLQQWATLGIRLVLTDLWERRPNRHAAY